MMDIEMVYDKLDAWGKWQRFQNAGNLSYATLDLTKPIGSVNAIKPVYRDPEAEQLDKIIINFIPPEFRKCLILNYVYRVDNCSGAVNMHCSISNYKIKRREAVRLLQGVLMIANSA